MILRGASGRLSLLLSVPSVENRVEHDQRQAETISPNAPAHWQRPKATPVDEREVVSLSPSAAQWSRPRRRSRIGEASVDQEDSDPEREQRREVIRRKIIGSNR